MLSAPGLPISLKIMLGKAYPSSQREGCDTKLHTFTELVGRQVLEDKHFSHGQEHIKRGHLRLCVG